MNRPRNAATRNSPVNSWFRMKANAESAEADIYIYDEIGYWGVTAKQFVNQLQALGDIKNINLHINSPGGDVFDGIAIYNALKNHGAAITVYIDGLAASMASIIAMVGNPVIMPENTMLMIHKPWGFAGGDANDMRDYADLLDKVENVLIPAYAHKTGMDPAKIAEMLEDETWLDGNECLALGFADKVIPSLTAMACINSKRLEEFEKMPQDLRNSLTRNPRNQAQAPQAPQATHTQEPPKDAATIIAEERERQKTRAEGINNIFGMFGNRHTDLLAECLADVDCSVDMAKDKLLAKLGKDVTPSNTTGAHIYADNGNIVGDSIKQALMSRAGYDNRENDNAYNTYSLKEMARASLQDRGISIAAANVLQMVGLAFTHSSSDFGNILLDVTNKSLLEGWDAAEETFPIWTKEGRLSDFKTSHRVGMGEFPSLNQVREGAEYKYVTVGDHGEPIALATYGNIFSITRQAIINDDLTVLTSVPRKMGEAAKATIGDLVYAVLTKNPAMSDKKALFSKDHGNLVSADISVDGFDEARKAMRLQRAAATKDANGKEVEGRTLNIRPAYALVPVALETLASQTIKSASVKGADVNSGVNNPIRDFATVVAEPRLDAHSEKEWYLTAAKGRDTIEVAYLDGITTPFIDQMEGFTMDGIATKVRIDAGVAPLDWRGLVKSNGGK